MGSFSGTAGGLAAGNTSTTGTTPLAHTFNGQQLRHVMIDGEPWFCAADICQCIGLGNTTMVLRPLSADERTIKTFEGKRRNYVTESGLYTIILRAQKRNPAVLAFQNWVTEEVLPSIRKTGSYNMADHGREQMPLPAEIAQLFQQMTTDSPVTNLQEVLPHLQ